jgi:hypothetical protein
VCIDEANYTIGFAALGLPWLQPQARTAEWLWTEAKKTALAQTAGRPADPAPETGASAERQTAPSEPG